MFGRVGLEPTTHSTHEVSEFPVTLTLNLKNWRWSCWSSYVLTHRNVIRTRTVLTFNRRMLYQLSYCEVRNFPVTPQFKLIKIIYTEFSSKRVHSIILPCRDKGSVFSECALNSLNGG